MRTSLTILYLISFLFLRVLGVKVEFYRRAEFKPIENLASGDGADVDNNVDTIFDIQVSE